MKTSLEQLDRAYAAGNHAAARELAQELLQSGHGDAERKRADQVLAETEIDWFLSAVGLLGLGLVAYLVYNYWL